MQGLGKAWGGRFTCARLWSSHAAHVHKLNSQKSSANLTGLASHAWCPGADSIAWVKSTVVFLDTSQLALPRSAMTQSLNPRAGNPAWSQATLHGRPQESKLETITDHNIVLPGVDSGDWSGQCCGDHGSLVLCKQAHMAGLSRAGGQHEGTSPRSLKLVFTHVSQLALVRPAMQSCLA